MNRKPMKLSTAPHAKSEWFQRAGKVDMLGGLSSKASPARLMA